MSRPATSSSAGARPASTPRAWIATALVAAGLAASALVATGCGDSARTELTVFAAASLTDALSDVGDAFEAADPGVSVRFSFAGSSSIREQVLAGAPADAFVPADPADAAALVDAGLARAPITVATNRLAIVVPAGNPGDVDGLADFADPSLFLGVCAPQVPCGALARRALEAAGVEATVDTEEPDVRALLTKVVAGDLDAGIVYATDVAAGGADVERVDLPGDIDVAAVYVAAVLTDAADPVLASSFVEFLAGAEAQTILRAHGFGPP